MAISYQPLKKLYESGKSMAEIAEALSCSIHKVVYWMDQYNMSRRSRSDAAYIKANPDGDPFTIKQNLSPDDMFLLGVGIGIYLGEGNKVAIHSLRVANSDPLVLKLFLKFLVRICTFKKERISYSIVCFRDTDPQEARAYWSKQLKTSPKKFGKITQIPSQGEGTYKRKSLYGVCTVQANNMKLRAWFFEKIRSLNAN